MRRCLVAAVGVLVLAATVLPMSAAGAGDVPRFCSPVAKGFKAIANLQLTDFGALEEGFTKGSKQFRKAAKTAPSDLRKSFKKVAKVFDEVAHIDASDIGDLTELAINTQVDFEKIRQAAADDCGIDIPAVPLFG